MRPADIIYRYYCTVILIHASARDATERDRCAGGQPCILIHASTRDATKVTV